MGLLRFWFGDQSEWHIGGPWIWQRAKSSTGEKLVYPSMRRRVDGKWQYRNMTDQEVRDYQEIMAHAP